MSGDVLLRMLAPESATEGWVRAGVLGVVALIVVLGLVVLMFWWPTDGR